MLNLTLPAHRALPQPDRSALLDWVLRVNGVHMPDHDMSTCGSLAVAHAGSSTLKGLLHNESAAFAHHFHLIKTTHLYARGARCFISTLRDPVRRLQSAFDSEKRSRYIVRSALVRSPPRSTLTPAALIEAFANPSHHAHHALMRIWHQSQRPGTYDEKSYFVQKNVFNGSLSLIPQAAYLEGLTPGQRDQVEIHVLCTHRLESDWQALLTKFGRNRTTVPHLRVNANRQDPLTGGNFVEGGWLHLNASQRAYVRDVMFPYDTVLVRAICGPDAFIDPP